MSTDLIQQPQPVEGELTIPQLAANMDKLREVMRSVMVENSDYGVVPGTRSKPTLLKPGGEKLAMMFRLAPQYEETLRELPNDHREYRVKCKLIHIPTQNFVGEASAVCSTLEAKYRWRGGALACPECGKSAIIKGKKEYGGGWICFAKKGGCGAKFPDEQFSTAMLERVENPDIADTYNTVQQIAQKRAFISAIKTVTASSELFTQDIEDGIVAGQEVAHETPPDDRRTHQRQAPPAAEKPKPELSRDFEQLRDGLYKMGVPQGNIEHANAVIGLVETGATIQQCAKDPKLACRVLDELIARQSTGATSEEIYSEALVKAGLKQAEPEEVAGTPKDDEIPY